MKRVNVVFTLFVTVCALLGMSMNDFRTLSVIPEMAPLSLHSNNRGLNTFAKVITSTDSDDKFVNDLLSYGYVILEIEVRNQTNISYEISQDSLELPNVTSKEIAHLFVKKSLPRSIGLKIASFFFWPVMIPSAIDSMVTYKNHRGLKVDLGIKSLKKEGETILPYSATKRFVFIKKTDWKEWAKQKSFDITLKENNCQKLLIVTTAIDFN